MFGSHLLPDPMHNTSPNTIVYFEIDQLRLVANQALQRMELLSA